MAERRTIEYIFGLIDDLSAYVLWLERERRDAERYAALGSSSELDTPITGAGHSDPTGAKALHPDAYAAACTRIEKSIEQALRRLYDRYRYDRDPAKEADPRQRRTMRDDDQGENGDAA